MHVQPTALGRFGPWLGGGAIAVWLAAVALVVIDSIRPAFPTAVTIAVLMVAATATFAAVVLFAMHWIEARIGSLTEALGRQASLLEQESARHARDARRGRRGRNQSQPQHPSAGLDPQVLDLTRRIDRKLRGSAS